MGKGDGIAHVGDLVTEPAELRRQMVAADTEILERPV